MKDAFFTFFLISFRFFPIVYTNFFLHFSVVGNLAIAWIITKFTEPIRVGLTLAVAPSIGKLFGQVPVEAK